MTLFSVRQLSVNKQQKTLLAIDNLNIAKNKLTAIIGANGAGKSTLLHALMGCQVGAVGEIRCLDKPIKTLSKQGKIAWVGQHESFNLPLTVMAYVLLGKVPTLGLYGGARACDKAQALALLKQFCLDGLVDKRIETLSGGEKQRLAIVRALMQDSEILLLDEPSNHLDIKYERLLFEVLRQLIVSGKSIVVVLHSLTHAYHYADEIIALKQGRVLACGDKNTVMSDDVLYKLYDTDIYRYDSPMGTVFV